MMVSVSKKKEDAILGDGEAVDEWVLADGDVKPDKAYDDYDPWCRFVPSHS